MLSASVFLLLSFTVVVSARQYQTCIGTSSDCCPGQQNVYPGDEVLMKTKIENGNSDQDWCSHVIVVSKEDSPCDGCNFTVKFVKSTPDFSPTVELQQADYTWGAFYGGGLVSFSTLAKYDGTVNRTLPNSVTTGHSVLKIKFGNTAKYAGELTIKVTTNSPIEHMKMNSEDWIYAGVGIGIVSAIVIGIVAGVVACVVKRRRIARRGGPTLLSSYAY